MNSRIHHENARDRSTANEGHVLVTKQVRSQGVATGVEGLDAHVDVAIHVTRSVCHARQANPELIRIAGRHVIDSPSESRDTGHIDLFPVEIGHRTVRRPHRTGVKDGDPLHLVEVEPVEKLALLEVLEGEGVDRRGEGDRGSGRRPTRGHLHVVGRFSEGPVRRRHSEHEPTGRRRRVGRRNGGGEVSVSVCGEIRLATIPVVATREGNSGQEKGNLDVSTHNALLSGPLAHWGGFPAVPGALVNEMFTRLTVRSAGNYDKRYEW